MTIINLSNKFHLILSINKTKSSSGLILPERLKILRKIILILLASNKCLKSILLKTILLHQWKKYSHFLFIRFDSFIINREIIPFGFVIIIFHTPFTFFVKLSLFRIFFVKIVQTSNSQRANTNNSAFPIFHLCL